MVSLLEVAYIPYCSIDTMRLIFVSAGGMSFFAPRYGFVCDNVLNYEVSRAHGDSV